MDNNMLGIILLNNLARPIHILSTKFDKVKEIKQKPASIKRLKFRISDSNHRFKTEKPKTIARILECDFILKKCIYEW
tara:strand:+ start:106 stop:339 length:234 start_codon:yes stop_codon:yes gene_type:complete